MVSNILVIHRRILKSTPKKSCWEWSYKWQQAMFISSFGFVRQTFKQTNRKVPEIASSFNTKEKVFRHIMRAKCTQKDSHYGNLFFSFQRIISRCISVHCDMQPSSTCDEIECDREKKNSLNIEKIYSVFLKKEQYKFHTKNSMLFEGLKFQTAQWLFSKFKRGRWEL